MGKPVKEKNQERTNLLRAILEETTDIIFIKDLKGRYLLVNKVGARYFGKTPEEVIGNDNSILDLPPGTPKEIEESDRKVIRTGETLTYEVKLNIAGALRTFLSTKSPYRDHLGKVIGVIAISRDITERKLDEEKLRTEHAFRKPIEDSILAGIVAVDLKGKMIYVNPAFCKMVGWKKEELIGSTPPFVFWPPGEIETITRKMQERLSVVGLRKVEYRFRRRNGELINTIVLSSPLTDGHGKRIGILASIHDITDLKRVEEALAAEKERLAVTLSSIADCIVTTGVGGRVNLLNKAAEILTGWKQEEAYGKPISRILKTAGETTWKPYKNIVEEVLDTGGMVNFIEGTILITRDGSQKTIEIGASPIQDQKGGIIGVVVVFRDITERTKLKGELLKVQKLESLGILAGGIAHDFNNILTAILGNISLAKSCLESKEHLLNRLTDAEKASLRASELAQQLLTFSKGGAPIKTLISIQGVMEHSVQFALTGSNIQSQFVFQEGLWPVEVDESQISQVIHNLVLNAQQAMPSGGTIRLEAKNLTITENGGEGVSLRKGDYLFISIQDQGTGISKDHLPKIFDPYFTTKQKGSGLGLSITYSIIQRHHGYITAESNPGAGTTFSIYLPASPQASVPQDRKTPEAMTRGKGRILVMDDEESVLHIAGATLKHLGYEVDLAKNGTEAVQIYKRARNSGYSFDVVITDLTVPGDIGGVETLRKLREIDPQVKVIVSSGYAHDPAMADFKSFGFSDCLKKPYRTFDVSQTVKRVLKTRRLDDRFNF